MSTDRELLEMAAKAARIELTWEEVAEDDPDCNAGWYCDIKGTCYPWQPLEDDGDALRLAVKLRLMVICDDEMGPTKHTLVETGYSERPVHAVEIHGNDPYAATRRAIVHVAAEIGKARHD